MRLRGIQQCMLASKARRQLCMVERRDGDRPGGHGHFDLPHLKFEALSKVSHSGDQPTTVRAFALMRLNAASTRTP
jgi:hypothetical protein